MCSCSRLFTFVSIPLLLSTLLAINAFFQVIIFGSQQISIRTLFNFSNTFCFFADAYCFSISIFCNNFDLNSSRMVEHMGNSEKCIQKEGENAKRWPIK